MKTENRKAFWIGACIGYIAPLVKLIVDTANANMATIQRAIADLEQFKPLDSLNSVTFLYLCIAILPVLIAFCCGCLGAIAVHSINFIKSKKERS